LNKVSAIHPMVLSVPVGNTSHLVDKHYVHACPEHYPYRPTRYVTVRPTGGAMSAIYVNDTRYVFCPTSPLPRDVVPEHRDRLTRYISDRLDAGLFSHPKDQYRFYILSRETAIPLPHHPTPSKNLRGHAYFSLADLTSGESVVDVASRSHP
jgi:hypothetical protein